MSQAAETNLQETQNQVCIDQLPAYFALSSYIAELTQNQSINGKLSPQEIENIRLHVTNLLDALSGIAEGVTITAKNTSAQNSVFKLLSYSISLLNNDKEKEELKKKYSDIENENCDLIQQITKLENQNNASDLAKKLNLFGVSTMDDIVEQVQGIRKSKDNLINEIIETFGLPQRTTESNIVELLKKKFNAQKQSNDASYFTASSQNSDIVSESKDEKIAALQATVLELKSRIAANEQVSSENSMLRSTLEKVKSDACVLQTALGKSRKSEEKKKKQLAAMKQEFNDLEEVKKQLEIKNESLTATVEQLKKMTTEVNNDAEVEQLNKKLAKTEEEKTKLLSLLDEFAEQFEQQQEELAQESKDRSSLVIAIHKLSMLNHDLEKLLENERKNVASLKQAKTIKKQAIQERSKEDNMIKIVNTLAQMVAECKDYETSERIGKILDDSNSSNEEKIENVVSTLLSMNDKNEQQNADNESSPEEINDNLVSAFVGILRFIEKLNSTGEIANWEQNAKSVDDAREALLKQTTRINQFITENANGLIEESSFFDFLVHENSAEDFERKISEVFSTYPKLSTNEGKSMFILLAQCIVANDVLRRYAKEAKIQCDQQCYDVKAVKTSAENAREELEAQYNDEISRLQNEIQEEKIKYEELVSTTNGIKTVLQNATTRSVDIPEIIESIEKINEKVPQLNQNKYVSELEKVIAAKSNDYLKLKEESEATINDLQTQINTLQEDHEKEMENAEKEKEEQLKSIEAITNNLNESEEMLQSLREENETLKQEIEASKDDIVKQTAELKEQLIKSTTELDALHDALDISASKHESEKNQLTKKLNEALAKVEYTKQQAKASMKKKISAIVAKFSEEDNKSKEIIASKEETIESLNKTIEEKEEALVDLNEKISQLNEENKEKEDAISKLQLEQKLMTTKLMSKEEKIKRDKSMHETQMKLKLFAMETDAQAKIDVIKSESSNAMQILLHELFNIVNSAFETTCDQSVEPVINEESIKNTLEEVCEKAKESYELEKRLSHALSDIEMIKSAIGASSAAKVTIAITEHLKEIEEQKKEIARITEESNQMKKDIVRVRSAIQQEKISKEWEEWARKVHLIVNDGICSVKSAKEIRHSIEEVVYAAMKNRIIWRRLDELRDEKKLIISGAHNVQASKNITSLSPLTSAFRFLLRIQKLSSISKSSFSFDRMREESKNFAADKQQVARGENPSAKPEKAPLFRKFVVSAKQNENIVQN